MEQDDCVKVTRAVAEQALARMRALGLLENSQNFHVWYTYFAGDCPDLVTEIDGALAAGKTIDDRACEALFARYFASDDQETAAREACARLDRVLADLQTELSRTQEEIGRHSATLRNACATPAGEQATDPAATIRSVLTAASGIVENGEALRASVARAGARLQSIQDALQAAYVESGFDALTKTANWKSFYSALRRFAVKSTEQRLPLALLIIDIDDLAAFNRRHGRAMGDQLLKMVAGRIREAVGELGFVARYAGDAFGVVLPQLELGDAIAIGERIRAGFDGRQIVNKATAHDLGSVSLSVGAAAYQDGESLALFVHRCLTALAQSRAGNDAATAQPAG